MNRIWHTTKHYAVPGLLILALLFSVICNLYLLEEVEELSWRVGMQEIGDVDEASIDTQIHDLRMETLTLRFIAYDLVSGGLLNTVNQYRLNEFTTCKDIVMRLGSYYSAYNIMYPDDLKDETFKTHIDGLIEANQDNDSSVRSWEHIEYCLINQ